MAFLLGLPGIVSSQQPHRRQLGKRTVLALSGRAGTIRPLSRDATTIPPKRFYLGGATNLRGFHEDGVLPGGRRRSVRAEVAACEPLIDRVGCTSSALEVL